MTHAVALVFPGQGSQRPGMLDGLPSSARLDLLLDEAEALSGLELRGLASNGPAEALSDTRAAQPLLYLAGWAWGSEALARGVRPVAVAGHSLGELAALAVAGAFPVGTGLELVVRRSVLMAEGAAARPGGMVAVLGLDADTVIESLSGIEGAWPANDNAPGQMVVSGTRAGIEAATAALKEAGAKRVVPLAVSGGFHSPLMADAASSFAQVLETTDFADTAIPVVQNASPSPATDGSVLRERLIAQMTSPVRWVETMTALAEMGVDMLYETGPGAVLSGLAKRVEGLSATSVEQTGIDGFLAEVGS